MAEKAKKGAAAKPEQQEKVTPTGAQPDEVTGDSGPGTGADAPAEDAARMPEGTVVESEAGPLEAPQDAKLQTQPEQGYEASSTDHTYAAAGGRTVAGEQHDGLVDEDGNAVSVEDLFDDEDGKTFVTVSKRVYEQFYYPNTTQQARRLLFVPGQRVNRAEAERIKSTL